MRRGNAHPEVCVCVCACACRFFSLDWRRQARCHADRNVIGHHATFTVTWSVTPRRPRWLRHCQPILRPALGVPRLVGKGFAMALFLEQASQEPFANVTGETLKGVCVCVFVRQAPRALRNGKSRPSRVPSRSGYRTFVLQSAVRATRLPTISVSGFEVLNTLHIFCCCRCRCLFPLPLGYSISWAIVFFFFCLFVCCCYCSLWGLIFCLVRLLAFVPFFTAPIRWLGGVSLGCATSWNWKYADRSGLSVLGWEVFLPFCLLCLNGS